MPATTWIPRIPPARAAGNKIGVSHQIFKEEPLHEIIVTLFRRRVVLYLVLAFAAGCVLLGLFFHRRGSPGIGERNSRYTEELRGAAETIGRLTEELDIFCGIL
jgi:hypothetical protein